MWQLLSACTLGMAFLTGCGHAGPVEEPGPVKPPRQTVRSAKTKEPIQPPSQPPESIKPEEICEPSVEPSLATDPVSTPEELLQRIQDLSRNKDYKQIANLLYPIVVGPQLTTRDAALWYMKEQDAEHTGDFSFSDEALALLILKVDGKFTTARVGMGVFHEGDAVLRELPKKNFLEFREGGIGVLVVQIKGEYKLLFWEGMNHLLENRSP